MNKPVGATLRVDRSKPLPSQDPTCFLKAAIIGMGGLGCPALLALFDVWPDTCKLELDIYDGDEIELSNLNRQILFSPLDIDKNKAEVAVETIRTLYPEKQQIQLQAIPKHATIAEIESTFSKYHFVLDCTDSISIKLALSKAAITHGYTLIYAGIEAYSGTCITINSRGPCLSCIFGEFSAEDISSLGGSCQEAGIIGPTAILAGALQVDLLLSDLRRSSVFFSSFSQNSELQAEPGSSNAYAIKNGAVSKKVFKKNPDCVFCSASIIDRQSPDRGMRS